MFTNWYVYLLRCADNTFYCGITSNIEKRLAVHNGLVCGGAKYTRSRRPVVLENYVLLPTKGEALRLEFYIKKLPRLKKITFMQDLHKSQKERGIL